MKRTHFRAASQVSSGLSEEFLLEKSGDIATLTFNRPAARNPLGLEGDGAKLEDVVRRINADTGIRAVVLTGAGRVFSAGGDLKSMRDRTGSFAGSGAELREKYRANIHRIVRAIWGIEVPVVAAVNGAAIGLGNDVACLADLRIAAADAVFGATFLKLGLVPGDGGAWLLPRVIGMARASELLYTGDTIDAATALAWGLVNKVVPPDQLAGEARALALRIAVQPPHALRMTKRLLREGQTGSFGGIMELSAAMQALAHHTEDHAEAVCAFFDKRPGQFVGR